MILVKEVSLTEVPHGPAPSRPAGARFAGAVILAIMVGLILILCFVTLPYLGGDTSGDWTKGPAPEGMVRVRGGSVLLPADRSRPARWVVVSDFWMDRHDVKEEDFDRFIAATGYVPVGEGKPDAECEPRSPPDHLPKRRSLLPREDARAYAAWTGKRLPTEAEVEWIRHEGLVSKNHTPDRRAWIGSLAFRCVKSPRYYTALCNCGGKRRWPGPTDPNFGPVAALNGRSLLSASWPSCGGSSPRPSSMPPSPIRNARATPDRRFSRSARFSSPPES